MINLFLILLIVSLFVLINEDIFLKFGFKVVFSLFLDFVDWRVEDNVDFELKLMVVGFINVILFGCGLSDIGDLRGELVFIRIIFIGWFDVVKGMEDFVCEFCILDVEFCGII